MHCHCFIKILFVIILLKSCKWHIIKFKRGKVCTTHRNIHVMWKTQWKLFRIQKRILIVLWEFLYQLYRNWFVVEV